MTYDETIQYLYASTPAFHLIGSDAYKPGLDNARKLLQALGNPHQSFRSIHVAGTNGKGSTSHLLAAVMQSAGLRTGLYTSPHLVDFGERIRIDGEKIEQTYVTHFVEEHHTLLEQIRPSFFETVMAMAFCYFRDRAVDIAVIEVGLGGRLDATNIITPILSVITNIGMDHTEYLGNTIEAIATEKAGIIKPHVPVVIGETDERTTPIFRSKAQQNEAPIVFADRQPDYSSSLTCELHGEYQQHNKQTARVAIEQLRQSGLPIQDRHIRQGFEQVCRLTKLQGRWQQIHDDPLIICDTGHNSHGIRHVAHQLQQLMEHRKLFIIFGMVADKDIDDVLQLMPQQALYHFVAPDSHRALPAEEMLRRAQNHGLHGQAFESFAEAIEKVLAEARPTDAIFIGGSNYLVGTALKYKATHNI
ncbi:MAG: bifunctional folylpolyglutamate synthase/dihydrofolate synthase [Paludibacteraceae bacterium]|nr:bifunctional folylpolyglutamate synthase/dihydrofolate synthase [Paludibacteraceae bacterium]